LAAVGGHFASSQMPLNSASETGIGAKLFAVRAPVNKVSRPAWSKGCKAPETARSMVCVMVLPISMLLGKKK
jgi:hypothetical protein